MSETIIQTLQNGPFWVKGPIQLLDTEGKAIPIRGETVGLCRCGHSSNNPFCDGCIGKTRFQLLPLL